MLEAILGPLLLMTVLAAVSGTLLGIASKVFYVWEDPRIAEVANVLAGAFGELWSGVINFIPAERINDVVYINPADLDYPVAFNVLEAVDASHHHLVASAVCKRLQSTYCGVDVW